MAILNAIQTFDPVLKKAAEEGPFALGMLCGCLLTVAVNWMSTRENVKRAELDLKREEYLHKQMKIKDDRITALHKEIERITKI